VVFTAAGVALLIWSGVAPLQDAILGSGHSGTVFYIFVEGMLMVAGALMIIAFNGPALAHAIERLATGHAGATPATRVGLAYPSRRAGRTSITLAIFALVLFTIVLLAVYSATLTGNLNNSIETQSGGYTYLGYSAQPIPDLPGQLAANSSLSPLFSHAVPLVTGQTDLVVPGFSANPYRDNLLSAPSNASPGSNFYDTERYPFLSTYHGMSDTAVMGQLATNSTVAVVDGNYASGGGFTSSGPHPIVSPGDVVRLVNPATGSSANVTVLGVLKETILNGVWIGPLAATHLGYSSVNGYLLTLNPGISSTAASQAMKAAFYRYGLVLIDFKAILADTTTIISADIGLLEVFIALGLAVGIAALGILALRAVTERRREIGMLRATGLTRTMILKAFLIEYSFVTIVGASVGGLLGVLLDYNFTISSGGQAAGVTTLYVPWWNLLTVILVTGLLATLAVIGPSLRAARLPPAEAVRGIE
jgi:putative ABC transport system permease protein